MTYKPWRVEQPVMKEDMNAPQKRVSGTTPQMIADNGGPYRAEHSHGFEYAVVMDDSGVPTIEGQTDEAEGHRHGIADAEKTSAAEDGHYHTLPPVTNHEYQPNPVGARSEGFDLLSMLDGDTRALGEWLNGLIKSGK